MKSTIKNLKFAWKYTKNNRKSLFIIGFVSIIDVLLNIVTPILSAKIIIELTTNNYKRIILIALMILIVNILSSIVNYIARNFSSKTYRDTLSMLEVDLGKNVLKLENNCLDNNSSGCIYSKTN